MYRGSPQCLGYVYTDVNSIYCMNVWITINRQWSSVDAALAILLSVWLRGYKVLLVLEDETDEINALIIGKSGEKVFGMPCKYLVFNQRSADQKQLPSEFLRLIERKKLSTFNFGSRRYSLNSNDFLIYNVSEDLNIKPVTPQSLAREVTVSSTTVLSFTTPVDTTGESHKRKRDEAEEISETNIQDVNQVPINDYFKEKGFP
ncbi:hypothetical protein DVH24_020969 [Malus domestica]|uniref:Uncharacterized protein n=1 Tax=Malus domestica TaxID=3750 RepID=A0A498J9X7_MALDO|nr:hypothetical protein DVH24_020969 [Malus domestica]